MLKPLIIPNFIARWIVEILQYKQVLRRLNQEKKIISSVDNQIISVNFI